MARPEAIRVNDKFLHAGMGSEWEVVSDSGFGRVVLFCAASRRFGHMLKREIRESSLWVKVPAAEETPAK